MDIGLMKKKSELLKVQAAAFDLQVILMEKKAELKRLEDSLEVQLTKEEQLKKELEAQGV